MSHSTTPETEVHRKVYFDGTAITIGPDGEGLGGVRIHTATKDAEDYWGKIDVTFPPQFAEAIGRALIACAIELSPPTQQDKK